MNMREMDTVTRVTFCNSIRIAAQYATEIDGMLDMLLYGRTSEPVGAFIERRESVMMRELAIVADRLGLALVDKAGVEEGEVQL